MIYEEFLQIHKKKVQQHKRKMGKPHANMRHRKDIHMNITHIKGHRDSIIIRILIKDKK